MTELKQTYYEDINGKASVAASSKKVVTKGSYRTRKEIREMTGEVKTYNMNKRLTWDEFKKWPEKYQIEYLQKIYEKFNPNTSDLAELFGVSCSTLFAFFKGSNVPRNPNTKHHPVSCKSMPSWVAFLEGQKEGVDPIVDEMVSDIVAEVEQPKDDHNNDIPEGVEHKELHGKGFDFCRFGFSGTREDLIDMVNCLPLNGTYNFTLIATKGAYGEEE